MDNQLRRPNITVLALSLLGFVNVVLAIAAGARGRQAAADLVSLSWLATPADRALFVIGVLMLLAAAIWTACDVRHDLKVLARWAQLGADAAQTPTRSRMNEDRNP